MMEAAWILNWLDKMMVFAIAIIGYFIKRGYAEQDLVNRTTRKTLEDILLEVRKTNGRVGKLEEWKAYHSRETADRHDSLERDIRELRNHPKP